MSERRRSLTIQNVKAPYFRIFPAEGALGGITPTRMFQINFYTEAPNIPSTVTHELTPEGKLGAQLSAETKGGEVTRELQSGILMTIDQAESLAKWILNTIGKRSADEKNDDSNEGIVM